MERFNLSYHKPWRELNNTMLCQLSMARSDEARRILLGIGEVNTHNIYAQCRKGDHKHCFVLKCECECHKHA